MSGVDVLAEMREAADYMKRHAFSTGMATDHVAADAMRNACSAVANLIDAVQETLYSHPVARTYSDGPCIERRQREELKSALARVTGGAA